MRLHRGFCSARTVCGSGAPGGETRTRPAAPAWPPLLRGQEGPGDRWGVPDGLCPPRPPCPAPAPQGEGTRLMGTVRGAESKAPGTGASSPLRVLSDSGPACPRDQGPGRAEGRSEKGEWWTDSQGRGHQGLEVILKNVPLPPPQNVSPLGSRAVRGAHTQQNFADENGSLALVWLSPPLRMLLRVRRSALGTRPRRAV